MENITLPPDRQAFISQMVASGRYASDQEVLIDALDMLKRRQQNQKQHLENLREEIQKGLEGPFEPWDVESVIEECKSQLKK